jgi:hypothetical protein
LWPDPVRLALFADKVTGVRLARGSQSRIVRSEIRQLASSGRSERAWEAAVAELPPLISALGATRASVEITLSNRFARYVHLPSSPALRAEADWQAFAEHRVTELFGLRAGRYSILLSAGERCSRLACAIEQELIDAISESLSGAGHRLTSLRPRFAGFFDRVRRRVGKGDAWLVDQESGHLTIGLAVAGEWRAIRQRRAEAKWSEQLGEILDREGELAGASGIDKAFVGGSHEMGEISPRVGKYALFSVRTG